MSERGSKILHNLDRFIGIPILFVLGIFVNKRKPIPTNIKRIAIIRTAAIGDTVLLSGIVQDIVKYDNIEVVLFAGSSNYELGLTIPNLNAVVKLQMNNMYQLFKDVRGAGEFDVVIDTGQWPRLDAIISFFFKSKFRIGFYTESQYKHFIFHRSIKHSCTIHEIQNFRNLIEPVINDRTSSMPLIKVTESVKLQNIISVLNKYIIFHPWPGGMNSYLKEWPSENWISLAEKIFEQGYDIIITGTQKDFKGSELIILGCKDNAQIKNMAGMLNLHETIQLVNSSHCLISVNTGVMHIGSALDKPVICLNGPSQGARWGPLNSRSISIDSPGKGCGFLNLGFEYAGNPTDCMTKISVDLVWVQFLKILNNY